MLLQLQVIRMNRDVVYGPMAASVLRQNIFSFPSFDSALIPSLATNQGDSASQRAAWLCVTAGLLAASVPLYQAAGKVSSESCPPSGRFHPEVLHLGSEILPYLFSFLPLHVLLL